MLQTPDGTDRLELFEYLHPDAIETQPNEIGMYRVAVSVDDLDEALEIAARHGCHPLRGVATYRDVYKPWPRTARSGSPARSVRRATSPRWNWRSRTPPSRGPTSTGPGSAAGWVRDGAVTDPRSPDERVQGVRTVLADIAGDPRLDAVALQSVGVKGWGGFTLSRRVS